MYVSPHKYLHLFNLLLLHADTRQHNVDFLQFQSKPLESVPIVFSVVRAFRLYDLQKYSTFTGHFLSIQPCFVPHSGGKSQNFETLFQIRCKVLGSGFIVFSTAGAFKMYDTQKS